MISHRFARMLIILISTAALGLVLFMVVFIGKEKILVRDDITLTHIVDTDDRELQDHFIWLKIQTSDLSDLKEVHLHYFSRGERHSLPMSRIGASGYYGSFLPGDEKGIRNYYYFEIEREEKPALLFPERAKTEFQSEYDYFKIRNEGPVSKPLLWIHILLMVAALFIFLHALYFAIDYLKTGEDLPKVWFATFWATLCFFISGFPIGWVIEKQVLGNYWEGIPFGTDITDSKTLFIFLYWLLILLLFRFRKLQDKRFAKAVILGAVFALILFLLPHSL